MSVFRINKTNNYTVMSNFHLQDKKDVVTKITNYYNNKLYITRDLYDIANNTTKEQEIKAYVNKNRDKNYER